MAPNVTANRSGASSSAPSGTLAERYDRGVGLRQKIPRKEHAGLHGPAEHDPVAILARGDRTRVPELVPVRYERMPASPFAFLRGATAMMAQDLRHQPTASRPLTTRWHLWRWPTRIARKAISSRNRSVMPQSNDKDRLIA